MPVIGHFQFFLKAFQRLFIFKYRVWDVWTQFVEVVWESFWVIAIMGGFVGAILTSQIFYQVKPFQADSYVGALSLSTLIRQVGPLFIAFILSGKVAARLAAELSFMKNTEQLQNLVTFGVDVLDRVIIPRLIGVSLASALLFIVGLFFSFLGGLCFAFIHLKISTPFYLSRIGEIVSYQSYASGLCKSFVFGAVLAWVSGYEGFFSSLGSEGVSKAVEAACVKSILIILLLNWVLSQFFF